MSDLFGPGFVRNGQNQVGLRKTFEGLEQVLSRRRGKVGLGISPNEEERRISVGIRDGRLAPADLDDAARGDFAGPPASDAPGPGSFRPEAGNAAEDQVEGSRQAASTSIAVASPPPIQIAATPRRFPPCRSA